MKKNISILLWLIKYVIKCDYEIRIGLGPKQFLVDIFLDLKNHLILCIGPEIPNFQVCLGPVFSFLFSVSLSHL